MEFVRRKIYSRKPLFLVVVDQFEEVFSLCHSEEERAAFISNRTYNCIKPEGHVIVLITLRADFYVHCANYFQLRGWRSLHRSLMKPTCWSAPMCKPWTTVRS